MFADVISGKLDSVVNIQNKKRFRFKATPLCNVHDSISFDTLSSYRLKIKVTDGMKSRHLRLLV